MRKLFFPFLLLLLTPAVLNAQQKMTPELLWKLKRVSADGISKNGQTVYYSSRSYDMETEQVTTKRYALKVQTGDLEELETNRTVVQRDGYVWYARKGKAIYRSDNRGRNWRTFGEIPEKAQFVRVSPNGKYIAFTQDVFIKPVLGTDIYPWLPKNTAQIYTDLNYRHWDEWEDGWFSHLFVVPVSGGQAVDLLEGEPFDIPQKPFGGLEDFVWSPDSKGIVYVTKKKHGKQYAVSTNTDLYYYDLADKKTVNLTANMNGYDTHPAFSPDGRFLAWTSMKREGYEADKNDIIVMDIKTRRALKLNLTEYWNGTVNNFVWSENGAKIYFTAPWRGTEQVFQVNFPGYSERIPVVRKLTQGNFNISQVIGQSAGELVVLRCDMNHAYEVFAVNISDGSMRPLTHENDKIYEPLALSKTELRMVKTKDGQDMGVWVIYPPDFDPAKKYPTLLYCQGGPQSALSQFYSFRWNFQLMAAQGYIIVAPNRRGMPGWGRQWNEIISENWGGDPMQDYLAAIDALAQEPFVDNSRLGCIGASYGGYSVFMLAGMHENRFKTFIAHDGLFDLKSWYGTTEELWFANWDLGGPYWKTPQPESYQKYDPSKYVAKWNTPILIIQGGMDFRVPIEQGLEAFQAAQLNGIKSKLLYFPNENHWILHPQNALVWQSEFFQWLNETL